MALDFQVRTTGELKPEELVALARLFEVVFGKPCPEDLFQRKFGRSCLGRSVHSLMFLDGELIGAFSAIPVRYKFFGRTVLFAITADLMIDKRHRGPLSRVQRLAEGMYEALAREGVAFVFCCLRHQVFGLHQAVSMWRAIGKVHYYAAPFRLPFLGPASGLARAGVRIWNWRLSLEPAAGRASSAGLAESQSVGTIARPTTAGGAVFEERAQAYAFEIEKVNDAEFAAWRYGIFPTKYETVALPGDGRAIYATELYYPVAGLPPGIRAGVLIDVFPLIKANFDAAVTAIRQLEPELNVLAYQGVLPFEARDMIRIPAKYERQPWTLAGRILDPDKVDERIFDLRHWNINLSNGDLV